MCASSIEHNADTVAMKETARERLAYLMWCYQEGYVKAEDRAIGDGNWLLLDASELHPDDVELREHLLVMADEVLRLIDGTVSDIPAHNGEPT
jgi:hypothetical protein